MTDELFLNEGLKRKNEFYKGMIIILVFKAFVLKSESSCALIVDFSGKSEISY